MKPNFKTTLSFALIFALLFFLLGALLSPIYELDHSCLHDSCAMCALISSLEYLYGMIEISLLVTALFGAVDLFGILFCDSNILLPPSLFTPVALKVKLSD